MMYLSLMFVSILQVYCALLNMDAWLKSAKNRPKQTAKATGLGDKIIKLIKNFTFVVSLSNLMISHLKLALHDFSFTQVFLWLVHHNCI